MSSEKQRDVAAGVEKVRMVGWLDVGDMDALHAAAVLDALACEPS